MTTEPGDDELEVSDLRPASRRGAGPRGVRRMLRQRVWRWGALAVSLALLVALSVSALPQAGVLVRALQTFGRASTPTVVTSIQISSQIDQSPVPTTIIRTPPAPPLALAPTSCAATAPALSHVGPPHLGAAIGHAPVWLGGTSGAYPTMRLGPAATANAYSWNAPYTQFGWPAPIGLVLQSGFIEPVQLSGWNRDDGQPVSFGFVEAGRWGAPTWVAGAYQLDPANSVVPAGGEDATDIFWYGYAFFPHAGCYTLAATWPGGGWQAIVSAGQ